MLGPTLFCFWILRMRDVWILVHSDNTKTLLRDQNLNNRQIITLRKEQIVLILK